MPAAEGVFPKAGFDPHYYSEANYATRGGGLGSAIWGGNASGTAWQNGGSILITAGSISRDPCLLVIHYVTPNVVNWSAPNQTRLFISGINGNFTLNNGSSNSQNTAIIYGVAHITMDANNGFGKAHSVINDLTAGSVSSMDFVNTATFSPSGTFIIYAQMKPATAQGSATSGAIFVYSSPGGMAY